MRTCRPYCSRCMSDNCGCYSVNQCCNNQSQIGATVIQTTETPNVGASTNTVTVSATGLYNRTIAAEVKVSPQTNNTLVAGVDGLYVPPSAETPNTVVDTATVDLNSSGVLGRQITAAVKVSATSGNTLTVVSDGLFAACCPETPNTVVDTASVNLTANGPLNRVIAADIIVSPNAGNQLSIQPNGVFVPAPAVQPQTPITPVDTATIDMVAGGTDNHTISANVKLDPAATNTLRATANGLILECADIAACVVIAPQTPLVANDSASLDFTTSGTDQHTLTGSVKLSATPGNSAVINPDGIFVPAAAAGPSDSLVNNGDNSFTHTAVDGAIVTVPFAHTLAAVAPASSSLRLTQPNGTNVDIDLCPIVANCPGGSGPQTPITVVDTASINLTASGLDNHTLQADIQLDSGPGNLLSINGSGLRVDCNAIAACIPVETPISVIDTTTVDLTVAGAGSHTVQADVKVSNTAGNVLSVNPDGLYVAAAAAGAQTPLTANDSATIDFSTSGPDQHTLTGDVKVSTSPGNTIQIYGDGIFAPTPASDSLVDNGNRSFTHTAVNGAQQSFCQGIQAITLGPGCSPGGVGPDYTLRYITLSGCTLDIGSAPEHYSVVSSQGIGNIAVPALGAGINGSPSLVTASVINPSLCRNLAVYFSYYSLWEYQMSANGRFHLELASSSDGSPFSVDQYEFAMAIPFDWIERRHISKGTASQLLPGASYSLAINPRINALTFNGGIWYDGTIQVDILGTTV